MVKTDSRKIVMSWCDSRVNGSVAGMLGVAFGAFGILRLYEGEQVPIASIIDSLMKFQIILSRWLLLTIGYGFVGFLGLYLFFRAVKYSTMATILGSEIDINNIFIYLEERIQDRKNYGWRSFISHYFANSDYALIAMVLLYLISFCAVAIRF